MITKLKNIKKNNKSKQNITQEFLGETKSFTYIYKIKKYKKFVKKN